MQETPTNVLRVPFGQGKEIYDGYIAGNAVWLIAITYNTTESVVRKMIMREGARRGFYTPVPRG